MNKRRKSNLFDKIISFQEPIEIKKKRSSTIKNLLLQRTKLNHSILKNYNSIEMNNQFLKDCASQYDSKTHFYQYRSMAFTKNGQTNSESVQKKLKVYNNNYKAFPRRSLLVKPHLTKNADLRLKASSKSMNQSVQSSNSIFSRTVYVQFAEDYADPIRMISPIYQRKRGHQRVQSAKVVRSHKLSAKLQPWQTVEDLCDEGHLDKCV